VLAHDIVVDNLSVRVWEQQASHQARPATVVFLHGMTDDGRCLTALAERLSAVGYRVLLPDAPGHGHSQLPPTFTVALRAAQTISAIEQLGEGSVVLGGHSLGAETAAVVAAQRPDLVRGLVLEEPYIHFGQPENSNNDEVRQWISGLQATDQAGRIAWARDDGPRWDDIELEPWATSKSLVNIELFDLPSDYLADWSDVARALTVPTLLVRGTSDGSIVDTSAAQRFLDLAPHAVALAVPETGHCVRRDNPVAFDSAMLGFLAGLN